MALHGGLDTVAIATQGAYTETYAAADPDNIANLFISLGYLEDAPTPTVPISVIYSTIYLGKKSLLYSTTQARLICM